MMNHIQKSICALALIAATTLPVMAESVDIRVTGTVVPAACTPTLSGGGNAEYGTIMTDTLSPTDYTVLPVKTLQLSISCTAPAKVALKAINQRIGSLVTEQSEYSNGFGVPPVALTSFGRAAGLGMSNGAKVGGYAIDLQNMTMDGSSTVYMVRHNTDWNDDSWVSNITHTLFPYNVVPDLKSFVTDYTHATPDAFTNFSATMRISAYLNKSSELDLTRPVTLDGLTTFEMVYL